MLELAVINYASMPRPLRWHVCACMCIIIIIIIALRNNYATLIHRLEATALRNNYATLIHRLEATGHLCVNSWNTPRYDLAIANIFVVDRSDIVFNCF